MSAADVAGLTSEQITQLMKVELARGKERETILGTVFDALYKREAAAKLKEERLAIPEAQRLAELKEQRERLEVLRKTLKTGPEITKLDAEARKINLDIQRTEALEKVIKSFGDQVVDIPGVGKWKVSDILRARPELLDKVVGLLGVTKGEALAQTKFIEGRRDWLAAEALRKAGVSDLAGLKPGMRDLVIEVQERSEAYWAEGKGLTTLKASTKAWKESEASFNAMKPLSKLIADRPTTVGPVTIEKGNTRETFDLVRGVLKTKTKYTHIYKLLIGNGWTDREARIIMNAAMDTEIDRDKALELIVKEKARGG